MYLYQTKTITPNSPLATQLQKYIHDEKLHECSFIHLDVHDKYIVVKQWYIDTNIYSAYNFYHPDPYLTQPWFFKNITNKINSIDLSSFEPRYPICIRTLCTIYENQYIKRKQSHVIRDMINNYYIPLPFSDNAKRKIHQLRYPNNRRPSRN